MNFSGAQRGIPAHREMSRPRNAEILGVEIAVFPAAIAAVSVGSTVPLNRQFAENDEFH